MTVAARSPSATAFHRLSRLAIVVGLLVGALAASQLALPTSTFACSCMAPDPAAPIFTGEEAAVFVGTAGQPLPNGAYEFAVERWFVGGNAPVVQVASERQPMPDGGMAINTCGLHFEVGDRLIMAAGLADGIYQPALCSPHAVVASDEGARLIEAATTTFGAGAPPGEQPPGETTGVGDAAFAIDIAGIALAGIGLIVLLAVLVTVYAVTHRGSDREAA